jgi:glucose-1-phosphate thymidylyltransferase
MENRLTDTLKIFIPMAGWGTRMRPHTWSKPKPLVSVGGKTSLDHLMDMFASLPDPANAEFIFIVGPFLGELQIPAYVNKHYPHLNAHYVVQHEMKGQSHALLLAKEHLHGPMLMCFSDTLMDTDFSFIADESADGVAWVKPVDDPRRFGVAELDPQGWVTRFIEKPQSMDNNLVVVGCYFFKDAARLLAAIEEQMRRNVMLKNEFFLTDAITIMIEQGAKFRTQRVDTWLDTGTIEATLETNRFMLERLKGERVERSTLETFQPLNVKVIPPVFIHESAQITNSEIGPYASIGAGCRISDSKIADSILEPGADVNAAALTHSLIGQQAKVEGRGADGPAAVLNIGDNSTVKL